jgi:hypothetical protein
MDLRDSIDDLDVLIADLTELRQRLSHAELRGVPEDALWEAEAGLRHAADRAERRAHVLRRAIELRRRQMHRRIA